MIGASAQSAISRHPTAEANIVANTLSSAGIPPSARISGLTMIMYEMAKNDLPPLPRACSARSLNSYRIPLSFLIILNMPNKKKGHVTFQCAFFSLK